MPGNKFMTWDATNKRYKEVAGQQSSAGGADANKVVSLDGAGKLDVTLLPTGVGPTVLSVSTSENLAAGDFVNLHNNAGTINARKADASNGRKAHGFVLASSTSGNPAVVYWGDTNTAVTGLTVGAEYYLSGATAGGVVTTAPTTAGHLIQRIGIANTATSLIVDIQEDVLELA